MIALEHQKSDSHPSYQNALEDLGEKLNRKIRSNRLEVPPLPHVASEIMVLAVNDRTTFAKLEDIVRLDQYLAGKIVGVANSAMYSRGGIKITVLRSAISRIGLRGVRDLAIAYALANKLFHSQSNTEFLRDIWTRSLAAAILSEQIARKIGKGTDYAFLGGFLHDIGIPIIVMAFEDIFRSAEKWKTYERPVRELLEREHPKIGYYISKRWNLPEPLGEIILHHQSEELPEHVPAYPIRLVQSALSLAPALGKIREDADDGFAEKAFSRLENLIPDHRIRLLIEEWPKMKDTAEQSFVSSVW